MTESQYTQLVKIVVESIVRQQKEREVKKSEN